MKRQALQAWFAAAAIPILIVVNHILFREFDRDYLRWYINSGALVGIVTAVFAAAWGDMDRNVLLISARPSHYVSGCMLLVSLPLISLGVQIGSLGSTMERRDNQLKAGDVGLLLDALIMIPWLLVLFVMLALWFVVIAPAQYLAFLLCGSLSRSLLRSEHRVIARTTYPVGFETKRVAKDAPTPEGWWDAGLARRPVTLTAGLSSLVFLFLRSLQT